MVVVVPSTDRIAILIEIAIVLVRMQTARFNLAPSHNARQYTIECLIPPRVANLPFKLLLINSNLIACLRSMEYRRRIC